MGGEQDGSAEEAEEGAEKLHAGAQGGEEEDDDAEWYRKEVGEEPGKPFPRCTHAPGSFLSCTLPVSTTSYVASACYVHVMCVMVCACGWLTTQSLMVFTSCLLWCLQMRGFPSDQGRGKADTSTRKDKEKHNAQMALCVTYHFKWIPRPQLLFLS